MFLFISLVLNIFVIQFIKEHKLKNLEYTFFDDKGGGMFNKKRFLRHKYVIFLGGFGLVLFIFSIFFEYDLFEGLVNFLYSFENFEMDELFLFTLFILMGFLLDFVTYREIEVQIFHRKELEKKHCENLNQEMMKHINFLHDISNDFSQPLMALFGLFEIFELKLKDVDIISKEELEERMKTLRVILNRIEDIMNNLREETKKFSE